MVEPLTDDVPVVAYTEHDLAYWRKRVARTGPVDVPADTPWPDADVLLVIGRFLATLDAASAPRSDDALRAALTSEDEIAHGEAWTEDDRGGHGLGRCAYCDGPWPCRTQRGIDRLLAALATPVSPSPDVEGRRLFDAVRAVITEGIDAPGVYDELHVAFYAIRDRESSS